MNEYDQGKAQKAQLRKALEAIYAAERAFTEAKVAADDVACQKALVRHREAIAALCKLPYNP